MLKRYLNKQQEKKINKKIKRLVNEFNNQGYPLSYKNMLKLFVKDAIFTEANHYINCFHYKKGRCYYLKNIVHPHYSCRYFSI